MIRILDSLQVAYTKIRLRKFRLLVTIFLSGITFSVIIAALLLSAGTFKSVDVFSKSGLGDRYIVSASLPPNADYAGPRFNNNIAVAARATALEDTLIAAKKAEAQRLGISYDPATEIPAVQTFGAGPAAQEIVNLSTAAGEQAAEEYDTTHPNPGMQTLKKLAAPYRPSAFYQSQPILFGSVTTSGGVKGGSLEALQDGKEPLLTSGGNAPTYAEEGVASFNDLLTSISDSLLQPFLLPGQTLKAGTNGSIPIVIPYSAAQQFLNLTTLSSNATAAQQLARLRQVRNQVGGYTFQACYRNAASSSLISEAASDQQAILQNQGNKSYQKPDLMYGMPTQACTAAPVIRDVRTSAEKQSDALQTTFNEAFGATAPAQSLLTFRVVGVVPDQQQGNATQVGQMLNTLFQSSLGAGWFIPTSQVTSDSVLPQFFLSRDQNPLAMLTTYYVEFHNPMDEQGFISAQTCTSNNPDTCLAKNQPFTIAPFGSNSAALNRMRHNFNRILSLAAAFAMMLAVIVMGGTVGRIIADSRRETAVFRAIGAKRVDITSIYMLYALLLSLLIVTFAVLVGIATAMVVSDHYSVAFTTRALIAYSPKDLSQTATLFGFNLRSIVIVVLCIFGIGIMSCIVPLIRSGRRNPIRDMREE